MPADYIKVIESEHTAQAFITTDLDDNQITAFHPGAMQQSHPNKVSDARDIAIGIVAPDGRDGMIQHAEQFAAAGIPFIFDPGQGLPMFGGDDLKRFIEQATWVAVNDYEWELMQQKTGWTGRTSPAGEGAHCDPRRPGLGDLHPGRGDRDSVREGQGGRGSDRLRGCLPRRSHTWTAARPGLADDGPDRLPHGGDQDRIARHPESSVYHGRVRGQAERSFGPG